MKFCVSDLIFMCVMNVLNKPLFMVTPEEKAQCVSWLIKTKSTFRLSEDTGLSMEKIRHYVLQFVNGTRNLWRQG